ncbi:MAG: DUF6873 family GME fold protein [Hyphomicrobiales bacterium]
MNKEETIIIADYRLPDEAIKKLTKEGKVIRFNAGNLTHPSIKGHPDLFFCKCGKQLIVAPNTPKEYIDLLKSKKINYTLGKEPTGKAHPDAARYNAVTINDTLLHNLKVTESKILSQYKEERTVDLPQAYSRCSIIPLDENTFITSDRGVEKALLKAGKEVLYVNPYPITLPGLPWGFFGGCCGINNKKLYFSGSLRFLKEEKEIRNLCKEKGYEIVELFEGSPFDGGSILFLS